MKTLLFIIGVRCGSGVDPTAAQIVRGTPKSVVGAPKPIFWNKHFPKLCIEPFKKTIIQHYVDLPSLLPLEILKNSESSHHEEQLSDQPECWKIQDC